MMDDVFYESFMPQLALTNPDDRMAIVRAEPGFQEFPDRAAFWVDTDAGYSMKFDIDQVGDDRRLVLRAADPHVAPVEPENPIWVKDDVLVAGRQFELASHYPLDFARTSFTALYISVNAIDLNSPIVSVLRFVAERS